MRVNDTILGLVLLGLGGFVIWSAAGFPATPGQKFGPGDFPTLIGAGLAVSGLVLMVSGLREIRAGAVLAVRPAWFADPARALDVAAVIGAVVGYHLAAPVAGFVPTAFACVAGLAWRLGARPLPATVFAATTAFVLHMVFAVGLQVGLPLGLLQHLLYR